MRARIARRVWRLWRLAGAAADMALIARSGLFDPSFYEAGRHDTQGFSPLAHYRLEGAKAGLRPNLYFDPLWYACMYLPRSARADPLAHYIRRGEAAGLRPVPSFDPAWYRRRYELRAGASPLAHYLAHRRTGRFAPNPLFDLSAYMAAHGEAVGPGRDPYAHFLRHGAPSQDEPATGDGGGSAWMARELRIPLVRRLADLAEAEAARPRA